MMIKKITEGVHIIGNTKLEYDVPTEVSEKIYAYIKSTFPNDYEDVEEKKEEPKKRESKKWL